MKKATFCLILSALFVLTVTQSSAKTNSSFSAAVSPWDYPITNHYGQPAPLRARIGKQLALPNKATALDDVALLLSNYDDHDFEIWLYPVGGDDWYYFDISPNRTDVPLTVPAGKYDIAFAPNDGGTLQYHLMTIGCDIWAGGYGPYTFWGVNITNSMTCNTISFN
jgi:hypothetical protein